MAIDPTQLPSGYATPGMWQARMEQARRAAEALRRGLLRFPDNPRLLELSQQAQSQYQLLRDQAPAAGAGGTVGLPPSWSPRDADHPIRPGRPVRGPWAPGRLPGPGGGRPGTAPPTISGGGTVPQTAFSPGPIASVDFGVIRPPATNPTAGGAADFGTVTPLPGYVPSANPAVVANAFPSAGDAFAAQYGGQQAAANAFRGPAVPTTVGGIMDAAAAQSNAGLMPEQAFGAPELRAGTPLATQYRTLAGQMPAAAAVPTTVPGVMGAAAAQSNALASAPGTVVNSQPSPAALANMAASAQRNPNGATWLPGDTSALPPDQLSGDWAYQLAPRGRLAADLQTWKGQLEVMRPTLANGTPEQQRRLRYLELRNAEAERMLAGPGHNGMVPVPQMTGLHIDPSDPYFAQSGSAALMGKLRDYANPNAFVTDSPYKPGVPGGATTAPPPAAVASPVGTNQLVQQVGGDFSTLQGVQPGGPASPSGVGTTTPTTPATAPTTPTGWPTTSAVALDRNGIPTEWAGTQGWSEQDRAALANVSAMMARGAHKLQPGSLQARDPSERAMIAGGMSRLGGDPRRFLRTYALASPGQGAPTLA